jgi:hypothetical protein
MPKKELRKKIILRPVERGQTPFSRKSRKISKKPNAQISFLEKNEAYQTS